MSTGIEKTDRFVEYLISQKEKIATDQDDATVASVLYDLAPDILAVQVLSLGISEFGKRQFVIGMLWQKYKDSEDDARLSDLLHDVKI